MQKKSIPSDDEILNATQVLVDACHGRAWNAGWYHDPRTGLEVQQNMGEIFALIHSEISEAQEGHRKSLMDDKLPHRRMVPVELFDAAIRIFDTIGKEFPEDVPALLEKMHYNDKRADHKPENRLRLMERSSDDPAPVRLRRLLGNRRRYDRLRRRARPPGHRQRRSMMKRREPCKLEGCDRPSKAKGLCEKHYNRLWAYGRIHQIRFTGGTLEERLVARHTIDVGTDCWEWTGYIDRQGYGRIDVTENSAGRARTYAMAHRVSYELHVGTIPSGLFACHHCDNRKCVNPAHLFLGTHADNQEDKVANQRSRSITTRYIFSSCVSAMNGM